MTENEQNNVEEQSTEVKKNRPKWFVGISAIVLLGLGVGSYNYLMADSTTQKADTQEQAPSTIKDSTEKKSSGSKNGNNEKNIEKKADIKKYDPFEDIFSKVEEPISRLVTTTNNAASSLLTQLALVTKDDKVNTKEEPVVSIPNRDDKPVLPVIPPKPPVYQAPVINVFGNFVVELGTAFNPYEFASVTDIYDSSIGLIVDMTAVDIHTSGVYPIYYSTGKNSKGLTAEPKVSYVTISSRPVIELSTTEITLPVRADFNPTDYVSASDLEDGDLTSSITYTKEGREDREGSHFVTYYVTDSTGLSSSKTLKINRTNEAPVIFARTVNLQMRQEFNPLDGVVAADKESGNLTSEIQVLSNNVDITKEGTYQVVLFVEDGNGKDVTFTRTYHVTNDAPIIHLENKSYHVLDFSQFTMEMALEGLKVTDREDGEIPNSKVTVDETQLSAIDMNLPGVYPLTYSVTDSDGAKTSLTITVTILNDDPIIHGAEDSVIHVGDVFDPLAGIEVSDREEGSLLHKLEVTDLDQFSASVPGEYRFSYKVTDSFGGKSEVIRKITVVNDNPTIELPAEITINVGDAFDPKSIIVVSDTEESSENLTITISGDFNINEVGTYSIKVEVTDSFGGYAEAYFTLIVTERKVPDLEIELIE